MCRSIESLEFCKLEKSNVFGYKSKASGLPHYKSEANHSSSPSFDQTLKSLVLRLHYIMSSSSILLLLVLALSLLVKALHGQEFQFHSFEFIQLSPKAFCNRVMLTKNIYELK